MGDEPGTLRRSVSLSVVSEQEDRKMTRATYLPLKVLAIASVLALAACVLALMATHKPAGAAFPGENGRIAFYGSLLGAGSHDEIYTMLPDGSDRRQLTSTTTAARLPAWSADGTKIAFNVVHQGSHEIYTMNSDGSRLTQLTPTDGIPSNQPVWSPDGTKIAFWSYSDGASGSNADVYVMNADGSGVRRLTTHPDRETAPAWSPDGTKIAFERHGATLSDIWVMNASDGVSQVNLTPNSAASLDLSPDWSPDGTKIVFSGGPWPAPNSELYTVNAAGSPRSALTNTPEVSEGDPAWSPDGTEILFNAYDITVGTVTGIWKMRADGTNRINLISSPSVYSADWQPIPSDTTPPSVTSTSPKANADEVAPTANVRATFSEEMDRNTINDTTFKLFEKGTSTQIAATVSYNSDTDTAKLDPTNTLREEVEYRAVVSTVAKDMAGDRLDQNSSTTGLQQKVWFFEIDD
jgi:Tol biopolymer transport system component